MRLTLMNMQLSDSSSRLIQNELRSAMGEGKDEFGRTFEYVGEMLVRNPIQNGKPKVNDSAHPAPAPASICSLAPLISLINSSLFIPKPKKNLLIIQNFSNLNSQFFLAMISLKVFSFIDFATPGRGFRKSGATFRTQMKSRVDEQSCWESTNRCGLIN